MIYSISTRMLSITPKLRSRLIKFRYGPSRGQQSSSVPHVATQQTPSSKPQPGEAIWDFQIPPRWRRKPLDENEINVINNGVWNCHINVRLRWIPGHRGLVGNGVRRFTGKAGLRTGAGQAISKPLCAQFIRKWGHNGPYWPTSAPQSQTRLSPNIAIGKVLQELSRIHTPFY
ncbi:hypothetical protein NQ317_011097 [Molorchus minor]|uniref:RNase H type-1 domain-containing protein n=1 Tax=Molorchus minor TaxID=1323400 RepID=A0ABQ9K3N2_9CUCU|nr:hypothetical protein NQ317_011097 [Molorchus minor]